MTRSESIHFILKSSDELAINASGEAQSAFLRFGDWQHSVTVSFTVDHLPQLEQLVRLMWAIKDEKDEATRQQLEAAIEQEYTETKDLAHLAPEF